MDNFLSREIDISELMPPVVKDTDEFKEIARVENKKLNEARLQIVNLFTYRFVNEADETGISRWEKMLKIKPSVSETLDFRRKRVLSRIQANQPYTIRYLSRLLSSLLGENSFQINLDIIKEHLDVLVKFDNNVPGNTIAQYYKELSELLDTIVPLNLSLGITNRREINSSLSFGGIISTRSKIQIGPVAFDMPNLNQGKYYAGFISTRSITTIQEVQK